jgi:hypothetical protein
MYCAKCGMDLGKKETVCPQCGQIATYSSPAPTSSMLRSQDLFRRTIHRLAWYWMFFAALNVALGVCGLFFVQTELTRQAGPWEPWPHPPLLEWTFIGNLAWILLGARIVLAVLAGIGMLNQADWGRPTAILAAIAAVTQFPIGLVLGAFTLVKLSGRDRAQNYRNLSWTQ